MDWMATHLKALGIVGGIAAFVGIILIAALGNDASMCSSGLGQFAQAVSSQAAGECAGYGIGNFFGWVLLVGGVGLVGTAWWASSRRPLEMEGPVLQSGTDTPDAAER